MDISRRSPFTMSFGAATPGKGERKDYPGTPLYNPKNYKSVVLFLFPHKQKSPIQEHPCKTSGKKILPFRVEIFFSEPVGLGLAWVVLDAYLCAWVNKKMPVTGYTSGKSSPWRLFHSSSLFFSLSRASAISPLIHSERFFMSFICS